MKFVNLFVGEHGIKDCLFQNLGKKTPMGLLRSSLEVDSRVQISYQGKQTHGFVNTRPLSTI